MKVILINEMKTQDDESTFLTLQMKLINNENDIVLIHT